MHFAFGDQRLAVGSRPAGRRWRVIEKQCFVCGSRNCGTDSSSRLSSMRRLGHRFKKANRCCISILQGEADAEDMPKRRNCAEVRFPLATLLRNFCLTDSSTEKSFVVTSERGLKKRENKKQKIKREYQETLLSPGIPGILRIPP